MLNISSYNINYLPSSSSILCSKKIPDDSKMEYNRENRIPHRGLSYSPAHLSALCTVYRHHKKTFFKSTGCTQRSGLCLLRCPQKLCSYSYLKEPQRLTCVPAPVHNPHSVGYSIVSYIGWYTLITQSQPKGEKLPHITVPPMSVWGMRKEDKNVKRGKNH